MRIEIPSGNWHIALANSLEIARDNDIIVVKSQAMKNLGERAGERMFPDKKFRFEIEDLTGDD